MPTFKTTRIHEVILTADLQQRFHGLGVAQHGEGCAITHDLSVDVGLVLTISDFLIECQAELGYEIAGVVEYYLANYHDLSAGHVPDWGLCTRLPGHEHNTSHPDYARSGLNADLLRLLEY